MAKQPGESAYSHHKRLIFGKLVDKTIDADYSELSPYLYGKEYSSDFARRMAYGSYRTLQLADEDRATKIKPEDIADEIDGNIIALKIEKQKLFDQRTAFNKMIRERSRQEELHEILRKAIENGKLSLLNYERSVVPLSDNDLLVSLNDIHYGANVQNYWNTYNTDVCREMMCHYLDRIISIGELHHSENCVVWENGDAISGSIHYSVAVTNKENVIDQIKGVSELIAEFLAELSKHFKTVSFVSVAGNHSRLNPNKDQSLICERLDDLVEWYLQARLQDFENIKIGAGEKIDSTMYLIDVRGKTYCGVHGDFDGSTTKVQALQAMARKPLYAILSGHMHHNKVDEVQGIKTIMAGSFLGVDDYCVKNRIVGGQEQTICVCDENGVRCFYNIQLS